MEKSKSFAHFDVPHMLAITFFISVKKTHPNQTS
jgi:hypothetical protein